MGSPFSAEEAQATSARLETAHPIEIIRWAVGRFKPAVAMTSSFGAESACLLHIAVQADPAINVRVVDTGLLFPETYAFIDELTRRFTLNLTVVKSKLDVKAFLKQHEGREPGHPDFCCSPWKVEATERALAGLACWITGIRRSQSKTRAATPIVDVLANGLVKVAPLATWTPKQVHAYMTEHRLPYHPLWEKGFTSIGCWPCTQRPVDPHDPRSGRWAGQSKTECGIHDIGKSPEAPPGPSAS